MPVLRLDPTDVHDNEFTNDLGGYYKVSPLARWCVWTDATVMLVKWYSTIALTYGDLAVRINGALYGSLQPTAQDDYNSAQIDLPAGRKRVEIVAGMHDGPTVLGAFPVMAYLAGGTICQVIDATTENRLIIYGDSIAVGAAAAVPPAQGWGALLREVWPGNVMWIGRGGMTFKDNNQDATARATFTARVAALNPAVLWMALGTNDYGYNYWTAAAFGTAYADLLDRLHAALPDLAVYAQSPIPRDVETANAGGSTLGDYRAAVAAACTGRAWCTFVDGTQIVSVSDTSDGTHPTTAGHAKFFAYVRGVLGV